MRLLRLPACLVVLLGLLVVPVWSQQTIPQLLTEIEQRITAIRALLPPPTCTFALASSSASVPAAASTGTVAVTTQPGCAWTASSAAPWATVAGGSGSGPASYSAQANTATAARTATLTIAGQPFTLTQAAASTPPTCTVAISPTSVSAVASAPPPGTVTITTTPAGCPWTASSAVSWVTVSATGGSGSGSLTYTVATNTGAARTGFLTIAGQTFTVNQAAGSTQPPGPGIVLLDRFEYAVGRDQVDKSAFQAAGWGGIKSNPQQAGAHGWIYTTTSIPGYTGAFPGGGSRVLALEMRPSAFPPPAGTDFYQTDAYLQFGGSSAPANTIPGDVWIQFWVYTQHSGSQTSTYGTRHKFLYVCNTDYPCNSHLWMIMSGSPTYNPNDMFPLGHPSQGQFLWALRNSAGQSQINNTTGDPDSPSNIGSPTHPEWMRPNRWTLVKMHFNTTHTTGNSWEVWLKPQGGAFVKVSEWIGGVTPGFTWNVPAASVGGHRVLRMPSTVDTDYWLYLDDFVIARTEAALPVYQ